MVNSYTGFDNLSEVWLGDCYPVDFYYDFEPNVRDAFEYITELTKQDLSKIEKILNKLDVTVHRPQFTNNRYDYTDKSGLLIKPPIMPRDDNLVLGHDFYHLRNRYRKDPWQKQIDKMHNDGVNLVKSSPELECLAPPSVVRCGKDIYIDYNTHEHVWSMVSGIFADWARDYRVHIIDTGGHSDGVFCPVAPGIIITSCWLNEYKKTFPDWEVFQLPKEIVKHFGKWWVHNKSLVNNSQFSDHINQFAIDWVGDFRETQFSVNMLVVNHSTVISVNENYKLNEFLDRRGIDVIVAPFDAKSFWDGGIHCLTVDTVRDCAKTDFFPGRGKNNYLDWM